MGAWSGTSPSVRTWRPGDLLPPAASLRAHHRMVLAIEKRLWIGPWLYGSAFRQRSGGIGGGRRTLRRARSNGYGDDWDTDQRTRPL